MTPPHTDTKKHIALLAALVSSVSILERAYSQKKPPNKVVGSNKMFEQMIADYNAVIAAERAAHVHSD